MAAGSDTRASAAAPVPLRIHLGWILLVKVLALAAIWYFFFSPAQRPHVDATAAARQVLGDGAPPPPKEAPHGT